MVAKIISLIVTLGTFGCTESNFGGVSGKMAGNGSKDDDTDQAVNDDGGGENPDEDAASDAGPDVDFATATSDEPGFKVDDGGNAVQWFKAKDELPEIDIGFFVDTSGSMGNEIDALQTNMAAFLTKFVEKSEKLKFQLFLVGGPKQNDITFPASVTNDARVEHIVQPIGSHDGLEIAQKFLSKSVAGTKISIRDAAVKELVFVTDDEAEGPDGVAFATFLAGRTDKVHIHGIVGQQASSCSIAEPGTSYINLANSSEHRGRVEDLCNTNWDAMLAALAADIEGRAKLEYVLKSKPSDPATVEVLVNGKKLETANFAYDPELNAVVINVSAAPKDGDKVVISFHTN